MVAPNGDIFVSVRSGPQRQGQPPQPGFIIGLRDTNGDGKIDMQEKFGTQGATGLVLRNGYLYFATPTSIERFKITPGELEAGGPGGSDRRRLSRRHQRGHQDKDIAFDDEGNVYVNVGLPSNACADPDRQPGAKGIDPCPQLEEHGGIWKFSADTPGQKFSKNRYATGMRQPVALAWHDGHLYVAMNSRDSLDTLFPEHFTPKTTRTGRSSRCCRSTGRRVRLAVLLLRRADQQDDPGAGVRRRRQGDRPLRAVRGAGRDLPRALRAGRSDVLHRRACCRRSIAAACS